MKKISQYLNYLIVTVVAAYAAFYYFNFKNKTAPIARDVAVEVKKTVNVDEVVNKYIKETADQIARDQMISKMAIKQQLSKPIIIPKKDDVNPQDIPAEQQIWKDTAVTNDPKISEQEYAAMLKLQDEQDKKEFARQYIENARKDGYHVILSPDLKVLSVTPIRKPSQSNDSFESFPSQ